MLNAPNVVMSIKFLRDSYFSKRNLILLLNRSKCNHLPKSYQDILLVKKAIALNKDNIGMDALKSIN